MGTARRQGLGDTDQAQNGTDDDDEADDIDDGVHDYLLRGGAAQTMPARLRTAMITTIRPIR